MFWSDRIAKQIIETGSHLPYWVDDMKTPSGIAHIGSLRGPIVHDLIYRSLLHAGKEAKFTYIFNDFDSVDELPPEFKEKLSPYLGFPLKKAPCPTSEFSCLGDYFADDLKKVLKTVGVHAEYLSSWDMYHEGKFNDVIRTALDNAEVIQDVYHEVSGSNKKEKGWLPLQVICEKCGKLGTTRVHAWNGKTVKYTCELTMVTWAQGCGYTGEISPFDGNGKLPWKVDWPAHWKVLGITIEGAGKDHSSAGGSRDIAKELCKKVFDYENPFDLPYEFILIGGKKMSSSKGIGLKGHDLTSLLPPTVGRFLFARTDYRQAVEFDPVETMAIPDLFDEYDRTWQAYITGSDENLARTFELSQIEELPPKEPTYLPRFRDVANYIQHPSINMLQKFQEDKGSPLSPFEQKLLKEREQYARVWIGQYAPSDYRIYMVETLPDEAQKLSDAQKQYLQEVVKLIEQDLQAEQLQYELYELAKKQGIQIKEAFAAIYISFIGKPFGPRAAVFLLQYPKEKVLERLQMAIEQKQITKEEKNYLFEQLHKNDLFDIDNAVAKKWPSITVGFAVIRGVTIEKTNEKLEKEKETFFETLKGLTNEQINSFPEVLAYRKLYKEMGVDWHSRRPSPEALLRRVAQGKGLYSVNTCVDAYNLVVMKNRVSCGAFDYDALQFPTILRFGKPTDEILLLGDKEPTKYKTTEVAYFDQKGGYNMDFNYRDAQRTAVTEKTTSLILNVDGVYDVTREKVEQTLKEAIEIITKYCGGTVELAGVVTAQ